MTAFMVAIRTVLSGLESGSGCVYCESIFDHMSLLCHLRSFILVEEYASHPHFQGNQEKLHGKTPKSRKTKVC